MFDSVSLSLLALFYVNPILHQILLMIVSRSTGFETSIVVLNCILVKSHDKKECIPVGCIPPARWPYPVVSHVSWRGSALPPRCRPPGCRPPPPGSRPHTSWIQTPSIFPVHVWKPTPFSQYMLESQPPPPLWTEWLTDRCKNITFPQLLLRVVTKFSFKSRKFIHCI